MPKGYIDGVISRVSNKPSLKSSGSKINYGYSNKVTNASAYTDTGTSSGSAKGVRSGVKTTMPNSKKKTNTYSKISSTNYKTSSTNTDTKNYSEKLAVDKITTNNVSATENFKKTSGN